MPHSFHGIKLRGIGGEQENFHAAAVCAEPFVYLRFLVIGSVVLNQVDAMIASVETWHQRVFEEINVGLGVEVVRLMPVGKLPTGNIDPRENFLGVSLAACWNLWLRIAARPCLMQRG